MEDSLYATNFGKINPLGGYIDGEELGHIKGLVGRFSPFELRIPRRFLAMSEAVEEVLEGQVEPFDCLLEGLGIGGLEKGVVLLQFG